ncbi:uncharacterized protein J3R85_001497 [Psidium guajava]|nr:uncharacterized protein J3R85_001497 [Psidium guajava]
MASIMKFVWMQACSPDKVSLAQSSMGNLYLCKPVYDVLIHGRRADCAPVNVSLSCPGFKTVKPIEPDILEPSDDYCIVIFGRQIYTDATINFTYAWDSQYPFKIAHLDFKCAPPSKLEEKGTVTMVRG